MKVKETKLLGAHFANVGDDGMGEAEVIYYIADGNIEHAVVLTGSNGKALYTAITVVDEGVNAAPACTFCDDFNDFVPSVVALLGSAASEYQMKLVPDA